jgi:origin recognition complex subunit 3
LLTFGDCNYLFIYFNVDYRGIDMNWLSCSSIFCNSEWVVKVPIILIFGVATTVDAPRNIFPSHALECLCPSTFMLVTPAERMDAIVVEVLVKHCTTFNIGHKVAQFLKNYFINQDGTVTSFIRALKVNDVNFGLLTVLYIAIL